jgi:hypothetical protein
VTLAQPRRDLPHGVQHDREVRLALARERRRQRDQDRVDLSEGVVVGRRRDQTGVDELPEHLRRHVLDVAVAAVQLVDAVLLNVEEHDAPAGGGEDLGERHAHVAGTDDGDLRFHTGARLARSAAATLEEASPSP